MAFSLYCIFAEKLTFSVIYLTRYLIVQLKKLGKKEWQRFCLMLPNEKNNSVSGIVSVSCFMVFIWNFQSALVLYSSNKIPSLDGGATRSFGDF